MPKVGPMPIKYFKDTAWSVESVWIKQIGNQNAYLRNWFYANNSVKGRICSPLSFFLIILSCETDSGTWFQCIPFSPIYVVQLICEYPEFVSANYWHLKSCWVLSLLGESIWSLASCAAVVLPSSCAWWGALAQTPTIARTACETQEPSGLELLAEHSSIVS